MSTSTMTAVPVAGWYEDPLTPSAVRWWNGRGWTEHTQAPPASDGDFATSWASFFDGPSTAGAAAPAAAPAVAPVAAPAVTPVTAPAVAPVTAPAVAPVAPTALPVAPTIAAGTVEAQLLADRPEILSADLPVRASVAHTHRTTDAAAQSSWLRPTHWNTPAVWAMAFTPWIGVVIAFAIGVLAVVGARWYVMLAAFLLLPLLWIAFAVRDNRRLAEFGYHRRASSAWVLLGPIVYLVVRGVRVHRVTGRGWAPLWVLFANIVIVAGAVLGLSVVVHADLLPQQIHSIETTIANDYAGQVALPPR